MAIKPRDPRKPIFGEEVIAELGPLQENGQPKKPAQSLEKRILHHDKEMAGIGYIREGNYYVDNYRRIAFVKENDEEARAHIFFGYSLSGIIPPQETMRTYMFQDGQAQKSLYNLLGELTQKYLSSEGRKRVSIVRDVTNSRVAFEYSVAYDPDDKTSLQANLSVIVEVAHRLHGEMEAEIEQKACSGRPIRYLTKDEVKETYRGARQANHQTKPVG